MAVLVLMECHYVEHALPTRISLALYSRHVETSFVPQLQGRRTPLSWAMNLAPSPLSISYWMSVPDA